MIRKTHEEFKKELEEAAKKVEVGGRYAHYKHPDRYYVVKSLVVIEATEEAGVVYEAQYGEKITFVRPLVSFLDSVETSNGMMPRFRRVSI